MGNFRSFLKIVIIAGLLTCATAQAARNQTITSDELDRVFNSIQKNNWSLVEKEVLPLIKRPAYPQRHLIARLRYIYLFSLAIQVENKTIKYDDLKSKLSIVENKLVIQPWHPVSQNTGLSFNKICSDKKNPSVLMTTQANNKATQIYSFEYFDMGSPINISSFKDQNARLGGILEKIEINQNLKNAMQSGSGVSWFFRLSFKDSFIDFER